MNNNPRGQRKINWGSLISFLIFLLVVAGGPIIGIVRRALGGVINLPSNLLPMLVIGLVVLSIVVSAARKLGGTIRQRGDTRLPTSAAPPARSSNAPMPPFGGSAAPRLPNAASNRPTVLPSAQPQFTRSQREQLPNRPQFEPLINPRVALVAVLGLVVLAVLGLVIVGSTL